MVRNASLPLLLLLGVAFVGSTTERTDARSLYLTGFIKKYPKLAPQAKKERCYVCHVRKRPKKVRNDYGQAIKKFIKPKAKKPAVIAKALESAAAEKKPATTVTFGELIKAGKLPGTPPKKK